MWLQSAVFGANVVLVVCNIVLSWGAFRMLKDARKNNENARKLCTTAMETYNHAAEVWTMVSDRDTTHNPNEQG